MLQRNSDSHKIKFLEAQQDVEPETKKEVEKREDIKPQKAKQLRGFDALGESYNPGKSIASSAGSVQNDYTSPSKQVKTPSSNTIWEPDKISQMKDKKDAKEETQNEKLMKQNWREEMRQERIDKMVDALKNTDTRSDQGVQNVSAPENTRYKRPSNAVSMFEEDEAFSNVPEMSEGEKVTANAKKHKTNDWAGHENKTSKGVINSLFDKLVNQND